jgi:hypothetical protein
VIMLGEGLTVLKTCRTPLVPPPLPQPFVRAIRERFAFCVSTFALLKSRFLGTPTRRCRVRLQCPDGIYSKKRGRKIGSGLNLKRKVDADYSGNLHIKKARARKDKITPA